MSRERVQILFWGQYMNKIKVWLAQIGWGDWTIEVASCDASFRRYYRIQKAQEHFILMDSSLLLESLILFVEINERLSRANVHVPQIIIKEMNLGYLILEDFGTTHYLDILTPQNYQILYPKAIDEIIKMQSANTNHLALYDEAFLHFEMDLMEEWYLQKHLQISLSSAQKSRLQNGLETISQVVLQQPQGVFVHRDFHSRNIMLTTQNEIGVIDFQDARSGAITYDLVSLLKDCYIEFDAKEVEKLALYYRDSVGLRISDETFLEWFDFMGLQRHIKVLGIFARLALRDGKEGYLADIPLTLKYVVQTSQKYESLKDFSQLLKEILGD